jgi:hypothetical protein
MVFLRNVMEDDHVPSDAAVAGPLSKSVIDAINLEAATFTETPAALLAAALSVGAVPAVGQQ